MFSLEIEIKLYVIIASIFCHQCGFRLYLNPSGARDGIHRDKEIRTWAADDLARFVAKASKAMVLTI